jgi:hypothetical protein
VDWNNDGKKDLISGDTKGQVWLFLNIGTDKEPVLAEGIRVQADGKPIIGARYQDETNNNSNNSETKSIIGHYSKLHFGDWNGDGLKDLMIGQDGDADHKLLFYRNIGTESDPKFAKPEPVELPGPTMSRPSPYLIDWDQDGKQDILFGSERPSVYFFKNVGTNQSPKLEAGKKFDLTGGDFDKGYRCRIDVTDWNNDGKLDILVGNFYSYKEPHAGNIWLFLQE